MKVASSCSTCQTGCSKWSKCISYDFQECEPLFLLQDVLCTHEKSFEVFPVFLNAIMFATEALPETRT